ncbi:hypothetical protein TXYLGN1_10310 [Tepidimicrobium xylanilyticum]
MLASRHNIGTNVKGWLNEEMMYKYVASCSETDTLNKLTMLYTNIIITKVNILT